LYFFVINACSDTGFGAGVDEGGVVGAVVDGAGDVVGVAVLGPDAGGAASSVEVQATAAASTNARTPANATRFMIPSVSAYSGNPSKVDTTIERER
jgi:hypothetical protein